MAALPLFLFLCLAFQTMGEPKCSLQNGVVIGSGMLHTKTVTDAAACCEACYNHPGCVAFTFATDTRDCFLKDNVFGKQSDSTRVSGTYASKTISTRACHLPGHTDYPFCNTSLTLDMRVKDLVSRLSISEKPPLLTARESPMGAIPRLGVPEYDWGTNCIHGVQSRCGTKCPTSFPNPNAQGAAWNRSLWRDMARVTGIELRALWLADYGENHNDNLPHLGLDCWSPNININRDPRWGRNLETPGEDPFLNGQYGAWHTMGLQEGEDARYLQAIVTLKHWDAYSLEDGGGGPGAPNRHNFNAIVSNADMAGTYFPAFKTAVKQGSAKGVMCSYNAVNGIPSCANKFLLQDVLRTAWNFSGYVSSDSGAVEDIYAHHHYLNTTAEEGVAAAIKAGCDIDSSLDKGHASTGSPYTWSISKAIDQGLIAESDVDVLLEHSLRMRFELGLFDPIEDQPYWHYSVEGNVSTVEHEDLNRLATRQGLVLLKNNLAKTAGGLVRALPLTPGQGKIAVLGPHANAKRAMVGNYLGQLCPDKYGSYSCVETPAAAMARVNGGNDSVIVSEGCAVATTSTSGFAAALAAASSTETKAVVMFMGLDTQHVEKEGHDRVDLGLPGVQLQLIQQVVAAMKGKKPVIVVMINGGAVALDWLKTPSNTDAILEAFYPGKLGSEAIADALFGVFSPGGKMPYTVMPASYVKEVDFLNMSMTAGTGRTYRFYTGEPLWQFGYGLSYSTFALRETLASNGLKDTKNVVELPTAYDEKVAPIFEIEVQNTGGITADEVLQAYFQPVDVQYQHAAPLPQRQLFDFQRVSLAPGERAKIKIKVPSASLALANAEGDLVSAPGTYKILFTNGADNWLPAGNTITKLLHLTGAESVVEPFPKASQSSSKQPTLAADVMRMPTGWMDEDSVYV